MMFNATECFRGEIMVIYSRIGAQLAKVSEPDSTHVCPVRLSIRNVNRAAIPDAKIVNRASFAGDISGSPITIMSCHVKLPSRVSTIWPTFPAYRSSLNVHLAATGDCTISNLLPCGCVVDVGTSADFASGMPDRIYTASMRKVPVLKSFGIDFR